MIKKLTKDESGMAMALAVIMVALLGVMGAGLLVFVNTDLNAVVETNQGQRAFEMADAGVKAAGHQLGNSQTTGKYDGGSDDSQWSLCYNKMPAVCTTSPASGVTLEDLDDESATSDSVVVTIRQIAANNTFKVVSTGEYGNAKRRIEAIFSARDISVPMGYYTTNNRDDSIDIRADARIHGMSVFAMGGAKVSSGHQFIGSDVLYGNWQTPFNTTGRTTATPGIGVVCKIQTDTSNVGSRDFDGGTALPSVCGGGGHGGGAGGGGGAVGGTETVSKEFVETPSVPQPTSQITFPFDRSQMTGAADTERLAYLKSVAQSNGTYVTETSPGSIITNSSGWKITNWPAGSTYDTVVYIELNQSFKNDGTLDKPKEITWDISSTPSCDEANPKKGILVIQNGNLDIPSNKALFSGVTILRGARPNEHDDAFNGDGTASCWEGPVNTDGETTISGKFGFFTGINPNAVYSGLRGAELQSWREVYSAG